MTSQRSLTIITPAHPERLTHLGETATSIADTRKMLRQRDIELQWVVALDGPGETPAELADVADTVVTLAHRQGPAAARNHALAEAVGAWVFPLDADDILAGDGVTAVMTHPRLDDLAWVASNRVTLNDWKPVVRWISQERHWHPRELEENWTSPFHFHPNNVMARRELAGAISGWPATGTNEDLGFSLGVSSLGPGLSVPAVTVGWRFWPGQTTGGLWHPLQKPRAFATIAALVNARRRVAGLPPIRCPEPSRLTDLPSQT